MKARQVEGLDPEMPLADAAKRIVRVRVDELHSFVPRALDPEEERALHDLRIAAKRLRYLLEVTAPCFGDYAARAAKRARALQDAVGEIHDCDVLLPEVRELLDELPAGDPARRGLETLASDTEARRGVLFERFLELWEDLRHEGFRERLEQALSEGHSSTLTRGN